MNEPDEVSVVEELYAARDDDGLLDHAHRVWDEQGPTRTSAEVARFARVAAFRSRPVEDNMWQARAVAAAALTGSHRSLALSLQQHFFKPLGSGDLVEAEAVLEMMTQLAASDHDGPPSQDLVDGILAERWGLLLTELEDWPAAAESYERAKGVCPPGRRLLKVRGGLARSKWLAGGPHDEAATAFEALVAESGVYPDVHEAAVTNLAAARAGDRSASVPFDLV